MINLPFIWVKAALCCEVSAYVIIRAVRFHM